MLGSPLRESRRIDTRRSILEAAWHLVREHGLAGLTLRELASRVGMRAPSLYSYFGSKDEIYDAMFRQAYDQLLEEMQPFFAAGMDRAIFRAGNRAFLQFCTSDPERYQLLFERPVPDFVPSPESYRLAKQLLDQLRDALCRLGIESESAVDLWTALSSGLIAQQISNDPGGERWSRLLDDAIDMYLDHVTVREE